MAMHSVSVPGERKAGLETELNAVYCSASTNCTDAYFVKAAVCFDRRGFNVIGLMETKTSEANEKAIAYICPPVKHVFM